MCISGIPENNKGENGAEDMFKVIRVKMFSKLMTNTKPQIWEAQIIPSKI